MHLSPGAPGSNTLSPRATHLDLQLASSAEYPQNQRQLAFRNLMESRPADLEKLGDILIDQLASKKAAARRLAANMLSQIVEITPVNRPSTNKTP